MGEWVTKRPRKLLRTLHDLTSVRSVYILLPGELDAYLFNMFMTDFLQERGTDIFRSKGTLCVHGHQRTFNFQGVHETFQLAPCHDEGFDIQSNPHSELVFIGKQLDKCAIKQVRPPPPFQFSTSSPLAFAAYFMTCSMSKIFFDINTCEAIVEYDSMSCRAY